MIDTTKYFIFWGIITFVSIILAFLVFMWLSRAPRFENRKKEIALGVSVCTLAIASFMFLPVLFSRIELHSIGSEVFSSIQEAESEATNPSENLKLAPFIKPFSRFLSVFLEKYIKLIIIGIPSLISLLFIIFTALIFSNIREPKSQIKKEYNRKHLFEYNDEIVSNLNRKK